MVLAKVWIEEGCVSCGLCADTCPDVFEMADDAAKVKDGADLGNEDSIKQAANDCPVTVIKFE